MKQKGIEIRLESQSEIILMIEKALIQITHLGVMSSMTQIYLQSIKSEDHKALTESSISTEVGKIEEHFTSKNNTYLLTSSANHLASGSRASVDVAQMESKMRPKNLQP